MIKKSLYPGVLFHFTKRSSLQKILISGFKVSYATERLVGPNGALDPIGVPMVSFCDLKISELHLHMHKYGSYGIGLKKEWAYRNQLHPVLYMNHQHSLIGRFYSGLKAVDSGSFKGTFEGDGLEEIMKGNRDIMNMIRYMKNYEGELTRKGKTGPYRFADEREWRYVPNVGSMDYAPSSVVKTTDWKKKWNSDIENEYKDVVFLGFEPDDIEYIVVENDLDISKFIGYIQESDKYTKAQVKLSTRILTAGQIARDV